MLSRRTLRKQTKKNYVKGIRFFCEFFQRRPVEILEKFRDLSEDEIIDRFSEFFAWARDRVASKSAWAGFQALRLGFLRMAYERLIELAGR